MTRAVFLTRFAYALRAVNAEVLDTYPHVYPTGAMIRVKIRPPWGSTLPPLVDPIGVIWLADQGELRSVLDSAGLGCQQLKLPEMECFALLQAADLPATKLRTGAEHAWRTALVATIDAYRRSPEYPWKG